MPKSIPVAIVTNADGTHLENFLPSLASIEEIESLALVDPSEAMVPQARKALGAKLRSVYRKRFAEMYKQYRPALTAGQPGTSATVTPGHRCRPGSEQPRPVREAGVRARDRFRAACEKGGRQASPLDAGDGQPHPRASGTGKRARIIQKRAALQRCGRLYGVEIHIVADQTRLTQKAYRATWQCSKARGGGGHLAWFGIMWLDMALYITGLKVEAVAGFAGNVGGQPIDVEDAAVLSLRFNRRCFGTMTSAYYLDRGVQSHIQIWGEHGWLRSWPPWRNNRSSGTLHARRFKEPRVQEFVYPRCRSARLHAVSAVGDTGQRRLEEPPDDRR